jgi:hypothetical protein
MGDMKRIRFSLRVMLVAVTLVSVVLGWVAYQRHWISERNRLRAWSFTQRMEHIYPEDDVIQPSWGLRLFGEPALPQMNIRLQEGEDEKTLDEFKRAFPECKVTIERGHWR